MGAYRAATRAKKQGSAGGSYGTHWGGGLTPRADGGDWVKAQLVTQVRFVEWAADGRLRHAAFLALPTDKRAREVRREP